MAFYSKMFSLRKNDQIAAPARILAPEVSAEETERRRQARIEHYAV